MSVHRPPGRSSILGKPVGPYRFAVTWEDSLRLAACELPDHLPAGLAKLLEQEELAFGRRRRRLLRHNAHNRGMSGATGQRTGIGPKNAGVADRVYSIWHYDGRSRAEHQRDYVSGTVVPAAGC
jgi:hypothetical protein